MKKKNIIMLLLFFTALFYVNISMTSVAAADEFDAFIRSEYLKWEKVARVARIVTD